MRRLTIALNLYRDRVLGLSMRSSWRIAKEFAQ